MTAKPLTQVPPIKKNKMIWLQIYGHHDMCLLPALVSRQGKALRGGSHERLVEVLMLCPVARMWARIDTAATDQGMKLKTVTRWGRLGIGDSSLWAVSLYLVSHFQNSH